MYSEARFVDVPAGVDGDSSVGDNGVAAAADDDSGRRDEVAESIGSSDGVLPVRDSRVRAGFKVQEPGLGGGDDAAADSCVA